MIALYHDHFELHGRIPEVFVQQQIGNFVGPKFGSIKLLQKN